MRMTFLNLNFGLLLGIGDGVLVKTDNGMIRLGDIVVSRPIGEHSGAIHYEHGKAECHLTSAGNGCFLATKKSLSRAMIAA
jgi:hypothetical protein